MSSLPKSKYIEIKDYILKEDIGEGNFGKVKLGVSKLSGEKFAIKIINKDQIKIKMKNKIFRENEVITKFNHINVIFVFEIIEDLENYYIVMEYCKRGELFDYIVDHERLTEDEAAIFFYQLINGVEYIHSKGIAHRDLKPENLLLTKDKTLKIIDFGLSHEYDGIDLLKTKCGSPSYASPEILRGRPYDGFKSDVWCCGIILYAMVCGYLPFDGDTNKILFKNILKCQPEVPDYLRDSTQDLIIRILTSDPDMRITIDEIKRHKFYLRGKKLCHIDYKLIEKNILKKRKNKSSFRLNEDDNTYFIAENLDDNEIIKKQIIEREEKKIKEIINEVNEEKKDKNGKINDINIRDKDNNNKDNNIKEFCDKEENDNNNKSKILKSKSNIESSIKNNSKGNSSNDLNFRKNDNNDKYQQNELNNKIEINTFRDSVINQNNNNDMKKQSFKQFNNGFNNEMEAIFSSKRLNLNNDNINFKSNNNTINKNKIDYVKTPKNNNNNNTLENNNKNKFNEFLHNLGKNIHINTYNNESKQKIFNFNLNNIDKNQKTLESKSPDKIIISKFTPTIAINDNNHNHILNTNSNQIFARIKNNINSNFLIHNNKKNIFFNNFKSNHNRNKEVSNEHSNNINNDISNENLMNTDNNNNVNSNNKNNKSPDCISLNSFNQIKLLNCKSSNKNSHNLYYNNINININNFNIKNGNNNKKTNNNYITNLNYINNENQIKYKINKKHSITNLHNSKKLYLNTDNNKKSLKLKNKTRDNNEMFSNHIPKNNYISITDGNKDKKLPSKTQENFYKPKNYYNFDKLSFHSVNKDNKRVINRKKTIQFKDNFFTNNNDIIKIRGGSEGRPFKHSHLDNFLQTIATNGFYKNRKGNKKIYFCGPINIKVSNNNYNVNNNPKNQILPIMFKK